MLLIIIIFLLHFPHAESQRGMEIAYKMLDKDGNGRLCKDEFLVVSSSLTDWLVRNVSMPLMNFIPL